MVGGLARDVAIGYAMGVEASSTKRIPIVRVGSLVIWPEERAIRAAHLRDQPPSGLVGSAVAAGGGANLNRGAGGIHLGGTTNNRR